MDGVDMVLASGQLRDESKTLYRHHQVIPGPFVHQICPVHMGPDNQSMGLNVCAKLCKTHVCQMVHVDFLISGILSDFVSILDKSLGGCSILIMDPLFGRNVMSTF